MTGQNPDLDPADIRGSASSDPHADVEDTEDLPGNYRTPDGANSNQCSTCSKPLPEAEVQCPFCAGESLVEPSVEDEGSVDEWSFGRVVLAVVEGQTKYHAQAFGAAAFAVSDDLTTGTEATHATVKCRAAFDAEPAPQLTDGYRLPGYYISLCARALLTRGREVFWNTTTTRKSTLRTALFIQ
ncbi:hypothetical protein ACODNH_01610 (plasmid) [Haloarcula sp. NS06]|uniref:hypothetical protein n=1 Tax=Haloarcula sp. NS06 TaxID=3409688 RepID=UPI003DA6E571